MKLQLLKDKIYARLPELKELSFGCEVCTKCEGIFRGLYCGKAYVDGPNIWSIIDVGQEFLLATLHELEILGHPITPIHILRCLGPDYAMDGEGKIWHYKARPVDGFVRVKLDLKNFSIDNLDEETIEFLLNNIK